MKTNKKIEWPYWVHVPILILLPFICPYSALATNILIYGIFAMGFNLLLGYTGLLSFGHASFFGLGAFTTGLFLLKLKTHVGVAIAAGVLMATLGGVVIGYISLKRREVYFAMLTLAFSQLLFFIGLQMKDLTGGDNGLAGIPIVKLPLGINLGRPLHSYYFMFVIFIVVSYFIRRLLKSPFGKAMQAVRENENRATSCGYNTRRIKFISFILSTLISGLSGSLYCIQLRFVPLETLGLNTNGEVIFMTLIGGLGTFWGPLVGSSVFLLLIDLTSKIIERWELIVGLVFIGFIMFLNRGICGLIEKARSARKQRRGAPAGSV